MWLFLNVLSVLVLSLAKFYVTDILFRGMFLHPKHPTSDGLALLQKSATLGTIILNLILLSDAYSGFS